MATPLQVQLFDAFLGTEEGIHSIILPDILSSGGSKNMWIDKYGRTKKILGYAKQNPADVMECASAGLDPSLGRGLFQFKKQSGGSTTRVFVAYMDSGFGVELFTSSDDGVTWTTRKVLGASSCTYIPDFAQFGDSLYVANGVIAPQVTTDGTTFANAASTQSPTPSMVTGASGALSGIYQYKLVSIKTGGSRGYGSAASIATTLSADQGNVSWTADSDLTVIGYELYRTTGNGAVFYYVDFIEGRTTVAYTDNVTDLTILSNRCLEEHGDPPPAGVYFCEPHKQRMWWFRTDTYPTRGYFSDPAHPDSMWLTSNYIEFSDSETVGDVLVGAIGNYEGQIVVFTERAVWTVSGTGQIIGNIVDWTRIRTNCQVGSVSHRSAARIPAGARFLDATGKTQLTPRVTIAYFTPFGDIRLFDGDNDTIISLPVKTLLSDFSYANRRKVFCLHDSVRCEVTWVYPGATDSEPSNAVTWNYRWGVWYSREWGFGHAIEADTVSDVQLLLGVSNSTAINGYVFKLWTGHDFDGAAFSGCWMTKTLFGVNEQSQPAMSNAKRFRWADFLFETDQTVRLLVEWLNGNTPDNGAAWGTTTISPIAMGILTANGDQIVTAGGTKDHIVLSSVSSELRALLINDAGRYLHDTGLRLRITDDTTFSTGSWSLEAMNLAYQILPGLQRRMQGE